MDLDDDSDAMELEEVELGPGIDIDDFELRKGTVVEFEFPVSDGDEIGKILAKVTRACRSSTNGKVLYCEKIHAENKKVAKAWRNLTKEADPTDIPVHACCAVGNCRTKCLLHVKRFTVVTGDYKKLVWVQNLSRRGAPDREDGEGQENNQPRARDGSAPDPASTFDIQKGLRELAELRRCLTKGNPHVSLDKLAELGETEGPKKSGSKRGRPFGEATVKFPEKKRRSHSVATSDSSDDGEIRDRRVFRVAPTQEYLQTMHRKYPGRLTAESLEQAQATMLGRRASHSDLGAGHQFSMTSYYMTIMQDLFRTNLRSAREARTLCRTIDLLLKGDVDSSLDILFQRLKALQKAQEDGHWDNAKFLELLPQETAGLITTRELSGIQKNRTVELKILSASRGHRDGTKHRGGDRMQGDRDRWGRQHPSPPRRVVLQPRERSRMNQREQQNRQAAPPRR